MTTLSNSLPATPDIGRVMAALRPDDIARFLGDRGYRLQGEKPGQVQLYGDAQGSGLVLPMEPSGPGFRTTIRELLTSFTAPTVTLDDVVMAVALGGIEVLRHQLFGPDVTASSLRLGFGAEAMANLFKAVNGVSMRLWSIGGGDGPRAAAHRLVDQARLGQSEVGSYVLKVYVPTAPIGLASSTGLRDLGYDTAEAMLENVGFVSSDAALDESTPPPPTMTPTVAMALSRLLPHSEGFGAGARISVSHALSTSKDRGSGDGAHELPRFVDVDSLASSRAATLYRRLSSRAKTERIVFDGYVVTLRSDNPARVAHPIKREIEVDTKIDGTDRKVRMELPDAIYRKAFSLQDQKRKVRVTAQLNERTKPWVVEQLYGFGPAPDSPDGTADSAPLFG